MRLIFVQTIIKEGLSKATTSLQLSIPFSFSSFSGHFHIYSFKIFKNSDCQYQSACYRDIEVQRPNVLPSVLFEQIILGMTFLDL
jgi:hypothetical protein